MTKQGVHGHVMIGCSRQDPFFFFGRLGPTFGSKMKLGSTASIAKNNYIKSKLTVAFFSIVFPVTIKIFKFLTFFQIRDPIVFLRKNSQKNNLASGFPVTLLFERTPRNSELKKGSEPNLFPAT